MLPTYKLEDILSCLHAPTLTIQECRQVAALIEKEQDRYCAEEQKVIQAALLNRSERFLQDAITKTFVSFTKLTNR